MIAEDRHESLSVPAILAYVIMAEIALAGFGIFAIIFAKIQVEAEMLGVLGSFVAAVFGYGNLALGYHLGSTAQQKVQNAAMAQLAGAGGAPAALDAMNESGKPDGAQSRA